MIIKSMSRKGPSFAQLIAYIDQGATTQDPIFARNIYASDQPKWTAQQFIDNHRHLPARKNGNSLYHEIIALKPQSGLSVEQMRSILLKLAERYTSLRGPKQLTYGRVHMDTQSPHIHLMSSSNELSRRARVRHSKADYRQIQIAMERYAKTAFPTLDLPDIYDRPKAKTGPKISNAEAEMIRRTGKPSTRQEITKTLQQEVGSKPTWAKVRELANRMGWNLYQRGRAWGLIVEGRKYRLSTLGIDIKPDPRLQELQTFAHARLHQFQERGKDGGRSR